MLSKTALLAIVGYLSLSASAETLNKNPACKVGTDLTADGDGSTYYYAPNDKQNCGVYFHSDENCDKNSYVRWEAQDPKGTNYQCGYIPLKGDKALRLQDCAALIRGNMMEGLWKFKYHFDNTDTPGYEENCNVQHKQVTVTGSTQTSTVTEVPTNVITSTITTTVTPTVTTTSSQVTVTSNTGTNTKTVYKTQPYKTITTTKEPRFTVTKKSFTKSQTTVTETPVCSPTPTQYAQCQKVISSSKKREADPNMQFRGAARPKLARRNDNKGQGMGSDGKYTTTVYPSPVYQTVTAAPSTVTVTETAEKTPASTTTVANPTPTVTIKTGGGIVTETKTLPQETKTKTKHGVLVTVVAETKTLVWTKTVQADAACTYA